MLVTQSLTGISTDKAERHSENRTNFQRFGLECNAMPTYKQSPLARDAIKKWANNSPQNTERTIEYRDKTSLPVWNRAGRHHGSVAGQDAVILAVNSRVVSSVTAFERTLGAPRADLGVLLTLRTSR